MFRRRWSSLPPDPEWPANLEKLGYFLHKSDEIRNIQRPNEYYKFFISRNMRWNDRQRFAMNQTVESIIHNRLEREHGMVQGRLPMGTPIDAPHVNIYMSKNLNTASRVVVLFGEAVQDLGVLAHRVIGGQGGVNMGSMCSVVAAIRTVFKDEDDTAIVIANPGQLWWWPEGKRGLTPSARHAIPMKSAVHWGREYDPSLNAIPGHETVGQHVKSFFEELLGKMARDDAKLAIVAVTDVADEVEAYLDSDDHWKVWGPKMESLALLGNYYSLDMIKSGGLRDFLQKRARAWISDDAPINTPICNDEGRASRRGVGCPVMSVGPGSHLAELLLINGHEAVLKWMKEVATTNDYQNPRFTIIEDPMEGETVNYWREEDGKDDTPSPEKKKPPMEELVEAVKNTSLKNNNGSPKKADKTKKTAVETKKATDQVAAGDVIKQEAPAQTPSQENWTQAAPPTTQTTCMEEVTANPVILEDPAEEAARIKKDVQEADTEKQARQKQKKEEEEASNLEHMRRTVLHALSGVEGMLGSVFNRGDSRIRADGDAEEEEEEEE